MLFNVIVIPVNVINGTNTSDINVTKKKGQPCVGPSFIFLLFIYFFLLLVRCKAGKTASTADVM